MPEHRRRLLSVMLALGVLLGGCGPSPIQGLNLYRGRERHPEPTARGGDTVQVSYLGVGGFLVRRGDDAILFAPSFTNPSFHAVNPFTPIRSDEELVARCLNRVPPLEGVEFILVGHAHYDHLLDVPVVMQRHARKATALGSRTMSHLLAGAGLTRRTLIVDGCSARDGAMGQWIYNAKRTVRVLPIASEHSPHWWIVKLMVGRYTKDRTSLPRTAWGWKEGQTYAYLVDFLHPDGSVAFRIHYQDAASRAPFGRVPEATKADYPRVDLAIACVGAYSTVEDYPIPLLVNEQPRHVLFGHWEDFFGNQQCEANDPEPQVVRLADMQEFIARVEQHKPPDTQWRMPYPYSTMDLPITSPPSSRPPPPAVECPTRPGELPRVSPPEPSILDAVPM